MAMAGRPVEDPDQGAIGASRRHDDPARRGVDGQEPAIRRVVDAGGDGALRRTIGGSPVHDAARNARAARTYRSRASLPADKMTLRS